QATQGFRFIAHDAGIEYAACHPPGMGKRHLITIEFHEPIVAGDLCTRASIYIGDGADLTLTIVIILMNLIDIQRDIVVFVWRQRQTRAKTFDFTVDRVLASIESRESSQALT